MSETLFQILIFALTGSVTSVIFSLFWWSMLRRSMRRYEEFIEKALTEVLASATLLAGTARQAAATVGKTRPVKENDEPPHSDQ